MFLDTQKNGYKLFLITDILASGVVPFTDLLGSSDAVSGFKLFLITDLYDLITLVATGHM